jgi:spermidine synthase
VRAEALNEIFLGEFASGVATWSKQPRPPQDLGELTLLALARANLGQEEARPLIEQLAAAAPVDAEALRGILAVEQKRYDDAARHLTTLARRVRAKPGATSRVLEAALQRMVQLAEREPRLAPTLFQAIGEPFAVYHLESRRKLSRYFIAQHVNDAARLEALADLEPNVPWNAEFLQARLSVYERTANPRAAKARRDLNEFLSWMPEPFVLRPGS